MIEYIKKVYNKSEKDFFDLVHKSLKEEKKMFIVTANPETMMFGEKNEEYHRILSDKNTVITPDGIGVVKAANYLGINLQQRITGVDITNELFRFGSENNLSVYFYGSKPEVLEKLSAVIKNHYPNLNIVGLKDGYNNNDDDVFEDIKLKKPDVVLIALGIPRQELLINKNIDDFEKGIFMGIGGSLDVISGTKKRAPKIFIKANCEWLYRLLKEPKRIKRFYNSNVKFFSVVKKEKRKENQ